MTQSINYKFMMVEPKVVFKARVNQLTFADDYAQVVFDSVTVGAYTDVKEEMLILFGSADGLDDRGRARVRFAPTSTILYFGWASRARGEGEAFLLDNTYITILDMFKPWTKTPRIDDTGVAYTDYNRNFSGYGLSSPVAILNCGTAVQRPLTTVDDEAVFTFDGSDSYDTENGDDIAIYAWGLPAGATIISGAVDEATISFSMAEGYDWVEFVISDAQGTTLRRHVLCIAGEPAGTIQFFDNMRLTRGASVKELKLRVGEYVLQTDYPNGCMGVLWEELYTDGVLTVPNAFEHIAFVGWHHSVDISGSTNLNGFIDSTNLTFRDIGGWLDLLPGYPIVIDRKLLASAWHEMPFADIDKYFVRLLKEYSNALELTDFTWSGKGKDRYFFPKLASKGETIYEQVDGRAQAITCKFTSQRLGTLHILPDPQLQAISGDITGWVRDLVEQADITESDWTSFKFSSSWFPRVNWNWGSAIVALATDADQVTNIPTVFCVAPGKAPSQGTAQRNTGEQLVRDQDELNYREGARYSIKMNNPFQNIDISIINIAFRNIDPGLMKYIRWTADIENAGKRGYEFSHDKFLPIDMSLGYNSNTGVLDLSVTAEPEGVGDSASTHVPPQTNPPEIPDDPTDDQPKDTLGNKIYLIHTDGQVSLTDDFDTPSASNGPSYDVSDLSLDGVVLCAVGDAFSPLYIGSGTTVNCWIVTSTRIYYVADIGNIVSRTVTSVHTFATASLKRAIQTERGYEQWVIVTSYYTASGTKACYSKYAKTAGTFNEVTISSSTMSQGGYQNPAGISFEFTGEITNFSGSGSISVERILNGFGLRVTVTLPKGTYKSNSCRFMINNTGTGITSMKVETHEVSGFGIPFTDWHPSTCPDIGNWGPLTTQEPGTQEDLWTTTTLLADGYEFEYTGLSGGNFVHFGGWTNTLRACPDSFPGGTYVFDLIVTELNGTPTYVASALEPAPTIHVSGKIFGRAYAGAVYGGAGALYRTNNSGYSWVRVTSPYNDFGDELGGAFMFPWEDNPDETIYYWGKYSSGTWSTYRNNSLITPETGYGPAGPQCFTACAIDRSKVAMIGKNSAGIVKGFRSENYGDSWNQILDQDTIETGYKGIHIADRNEVMYIWGPAGVAYSENSGSEFDSRIGDADTSEVILVGGW